MRDIITLMSGYDKEQVTYFAETDFRGRHVRFGIRNEDRLQHIYVIGKTGTGKSTLLENMMAQDLQRGNGMALIDPHGSAAETMLSYIPSHRKEDVVYFAPFDSEYPLGFNVLETVGPDQRNIVANNLMSIFEKIWPDTFSERMKYILFNCVMALLEVPDSTLLGVNRMLIDKEYLKQIISQVKDTTVRDFWENDYMQWDDRYRKEAGASIQNKIGQFTANPLIRNIVGQTKTSFNMREMMDSGKILIANMSKGRLGETNARLLGGLINTQVYLAAMSRANLSKNELDEKPAFFLYVDEFQNFASESFASVLSEARKYKLSLIMAHQYVEQMPEVVRDAIFGNVGTLITFRVGPLDADHFEKQFAPTFEATDFTSLEFAHIYLSLMIRKKGSKPFSARTLLPLPQQPDSIKDEIIELSRRKFGTKREIVEAEIDKWFTPILSEKQIQHQEYLAKKKAEIEASGGVWVDNSNSNDKGEKVNIQKKTYLKVESRNKSVKENAPSKTNSNFTPKVTNIRTSKTQVNRVGVNERKKVIHVNEQNRPNDIVLNKKLNSNSNKNHPSTKLTGLLEKLEVGSQDNTQSANHKTGIKKAGNNTNFDKKQKNVDSKSKVNLKSELVVDSGANDRSNLKEALKVAVSNYEKKVSNNRQEPYEKTGNSEKQRSVSTNTNTNDPLVKKNSQNDKRDNTKNSLVFQPPESKVSSKQTGVPNSVLRTILDQ